MQHSHTHNHVTLRAAAPLSKPWTATAGHAKDIDRQSHHHVPPLLVIDIVAVVVVFVAAKVVVGLLRLRLLLLPFGFHACNRRVRFGVVHESCQSEK